MLKGSRITVRTCCRLAYSTSTEAVASSSKEKQPIVIPKRIKRSPTALLEALASTVDPFADTTGAHYKYHDDPYLLPTSASSKRMYSLAKEAGRKVAREFAKEWPTLFMYDEDFPRLNAFRPVKKTDADEEKGCSVAELQDRIGKGWVSHAAKVFKNMQDAGEVETIPDNLRYELLEFLAFHNSEDPSGMQHSDYISDRWENKYFKSVRELRSVWELGGAAEIVFRSLSNPSARAHSALIAGRCRYLADEKGLELLQEVRQNGMVPSIEAYNAAIKSTAVVEQTAAARWSRAQSILNWMAEDGVKPNLQTFNSCLQLLASNKHWWSECDTVTEQLLQEMAETGVEPSAATYYHLIKIFDGDKSACSATIMQCLDQIEAKGGLLELRDENDCLFFPSAMQMIANLRRLPLAYRLYDIFRKGNNSCLITDADGEGIFHSNLLRLVTEMENTDKMLEVYTHLVPYFLTPDDDTWRSVLSNVETHGRYERTTHIYTDLVCTGAVWRRSIVDPLVRLMLRAQHSASSGLSKQVETDFASICWDIKQRTDGQYGIQGRNRVDLPWTAQRIVAMALVCARAGAQPYADAIFAHLRPVDYSAMKPEDRPQGAVITLRDEPHSNELLSYFEICLKLGEFDRIVNVLETTDQIGSVVIQKMIESADKSKYLNDSQKRKIRDFATNIRVQEESSEFL